jgi:cyanate permease
VSYFPWRVVVFGMGMLGILLGFCFLIFVPATSLIENHHTSSMHRLQAPVGWPDIIAILKNPQNWLLTLYNGLIFSPVGVFTGIWGISFLKHGCHINARLANILSACVFIGFGIGSPYIGLLADRSRSSKRIMLYSGCLGLCAVLLLIYAPLSSWLLGVALFAIGCSAGTVMLGFVLGKALNSVRTEATLVTLLNTGGVAITAMTEPLIGYLLDTHWNGQWLSEGVRYFSLANYQHGLIVLPLYLVSALVLLYYIREPRT